MLALADQTNAACPCLQWVRGGKSGLHRAECQLTAGGVSLRQVQQRVDRLSNKVRVKGWGKSPPHDW